MPVEQLAAVEPFSANYQASYMGMQANGKMTLESAGQNRWRYSLSIKNSLADLSQSTVFEVRDGQWLKKGDVILIELHAPGPTGNYVAMQYWSDIFTAIKAAEQKLLETQDSKAYLGPEGDMGFVHALMPYVFGGDDPTRGGRIEGMQTPGGTGALHHALVESSERRGVSPPVPCEATMTTIDRILEKQHTDDSQP